MAESLERGAAAGRRLARFVVVVGLRFYQDGCLTSAAALAYSTLLSMVPLLALMFAVLKGLGAQNLLLPYMVGRLALDPEVVERIVSYIDRTNVGTLGALGAAFLIFTVISLMGSIESRLNHVWRVRRSRTLWRKAADYSSVVLLTPLLLLGAVAITSSLRVQEVLQWVVEREVIGSVVLGSLRLAPIVINAVAIGLLYAVIPNRRPSVSAVAVGALVAGVVWQTVQLTYVALQIGVARYNAIYGALAQLPVTLVWLYVSWVVLLAGAELAAVYEFGGAADDRGRRPISRWAIALELLVGAADRFRRAGGPLNTHAVARRLQVDPEAMGQVVDALAEKRWLAAVEGAPGRYVLTCDPALIDLGLLELADGGQTPPVCDQRVLRVLADVTGRQHAVWKGWRLSAVLAAR